ncbi:FAD-dependent oxidoreductase [Demequina sp. B12]|uniref:FAD-binding protein n=1 Tax=Demequina sp. B12 TaxID=2992757 RepID=UPI00237C31A9|nr:FAD-binding protein [Demequina sp. B12]MDE0573927.1 FAD-dependent oxidoreductase [Demequina sp. B12]
MQEWDEEVDLLVAGSGAAALSAAIAGADEGLQVLVVESTDKWGGTTAISGGGLWMPNHPDMEKLGKQDSPEKTLEYMDVTIGDVGPASSTARREAYVHGVTAVYNEWRRLGITWALSADYPDYYPDKPGGMDGGRAIETEPFDAKRLGSWHDSSRAMLPAPLKTDDVWLLTRAWSSASGFRRGAQFVGRTLKGVATGKKLYGLGGAYAGHLMATAKKLGVEVRLRTPIVSVIKDGDVVVGAEIRTPGGIKRVHTRAGVMLGTGGFARNKEWRKEHHGIEGYTSAPEGDDGSGIQVGIDAGADVALMDDAWWGASIMMPDGEAQFSVNERSDPYSIIVDQSGQRFCNESASYIDVGHAILERDKTVPAIHSWMLTERRHHRKFLNNAALQGLNKLKKAGSVVEADTLEDLAAKLGMDEDVLLATVARFNGFCRTGVDEDFDRGRTAYDNYYGDPSLKNPNLGPLEKGPFRAFKIVPGDLGTKGGLLTDEHARVLDTAGTPIEGLYAAGNTTASVMGRTYPGAGSTIGPATVFGFLGAKHAATRISTSAH